MGDKIRNAPEPILYINVASVLRRQSRDTYHSIVQLFKHWPFVREKQKINEKPSEFI